MAKHLKRFLAVFMIVIMVAAYIPMAGADSFFGIEASAIVTNGKVKLGDNIKWTYDKNSRTITISGSGAMYNYSNGDSGQRWDELVLGMTHYPNKDARNIVISNGITSIGNNVFNGLNKITSVSIPASVKSIGTGSFKGCSSLSSVSIPAAVTSVGNSAFEGCSNLSSVTINTGLKTIGSSAFKNTKFKSVSLPYTVTSIGASAFAGISGLKFTCAYGDAAYKYCKSNSVSYALKTPALVVDAVFDAANKQVVVTLKVNNAAGLNAANFELTYNNGISPVSTDTSCGDMSEAITTAVVYNGNGKISVGVVASDCVPFVADTQTVSYEIVKLKFKVSKNEGTADFNFSSKAFMIDNAKVNVAAVSKSVNLHEHEYVEDSANYVAPTCKAEGTKAYKCLICNKTTTEKIPVDASNHTGKTEIKNAVEATCTAKGYTGDKVCLDCGAVLEKGSELIATGHKHAVVESVESDCQNTGYTKYTCSVCGDTYTETAEQLAGHKYESTVITEATCTSAGELNHECSVCGHSHKEIVKATGHSFVDEIVAPSCVAAGYTVHTCSVCNSSYMSDVTPGVGHEYDETGRCVRCGDVRVTEIVFVQNNFFEITNITINSGDSDSSDIEETVVKIITSKSALITAEDFLSNVEGDGWFITNSKGEAVENGSYVTTDCSISHEGDSNVEYKVVICGDVNADGKVTAADARLVLRTAAALETLTDIKTVAADVDANNKVVAADARRILRVSSRIDVFK